MDIVLWLIVAIEFQNVNVKKYRWLICRFVVSMPYMHLVSDLVTTWFCNALEELRLAQISIGRRNHGLGDRRLMILITLNSRTTKKKKKKFQKFFECYYRKSEVCCHTFGSLYPLRDCRSSDQYNFILNQMKKNFE